MSRRPSPLAAPRRPRLVGLTAALGTLALLGAAVLGWALLTIYGAGPSGDGVRTVVLRRGAGLSEIASTLDRAGVIRSATLFSTYAQATGAASRLRAGEYAFPAGGSMADVMARLRRGEIVRHFVTVPEGVTSEMAVEILNRSPVLTGVAPVPPEGALLPETYQVSRGDDRAAVLTRMMDARDRTLQRLWANRADDLPYATREQAVILASIVEKETGVASERPRVAAVYVNRLRQGIPLQADPTVVYGVSRGRPLGRGLRRSELDADTPYNTYRNPGLTPTPIANPGAASLAAVINPPVTDELFFVADGTGGHAFARTLAEHNANVARWRTIEAQRAVGAAAPGSTQNVE